MKIEGSTTKSNNNNNNSKLSIPFGISQNQEMMCSQFQFTSNETKTLKVKTEN
jgi:hypothetical protein